MYYCVKLQLTIISLNDLSPTTFCYELLFVKFFFNNDVIFSKSSNRGDNDNNSPPFAGTVTWSVGTTTTQNTVMGHLQMFLDYNYFNPVSYMGALLEVFPEGEGRNERAVKITVFLRLWTYCSACPKGLHGRSPSFLPAQILNYLR